MYRFCPKSQLKLPAVLIALLVCCMPMSASAASNAYMVATGETQGIIEGSVDLAGREGQIEIVEYGHSIGLAIDNATGLPAGNQQHRAIRVTKEIDKSTPILMEVLNTKEKLTGVIIRFYRPRTPGFEDDFFTVELNDAYIVNIFQSSRTHTDEDWNQVLNVPINETLTITYNKIIWTWKAGSITSEAYWTQGQK